VSRIERKGLKIIAMKLMHMSKELAEKQYEEHRGKEFYESLLAYMTSGPVLSMVLKGADAVAALRQLCGATNPAQASPGTIRGDFAQITRKNIIHASDSPESAAREIGLFFSKEELCEYEDTHDIWLF